MKRVFAVVVAVLLCATVFAKGKKDAGSVLTVGATPEPHAEMLNLVKDDLAKQGITLKVVEFTDYVTPNEALESGQIDANFFQHIPYMDSFNKEKGYHLVNAGGIHVEPIVLYSKKVSSLADLADGAEIAIPNDPTNEGRALLLLQSAGLITLKEEAGITATPLDVVSNSKNLKFRELEAASFPRVINDVDAAVINGNYAIPAGLSAVNDGLFVEGADSPYVNIIAVNDGNQDAPEIKALVKALQSEKVKEWIKNRYPNSEVVPVF
ncbi:MAG: MetQ/NlpA family ABC transporter substrate-binding protein [Spirochaetaceae bacterium]|nr:MetQ/NlpA family ABC transporter substrate-binding protein [Spirochaetaceae bacterium]